MRNHYHFAQYTGDDGLSVSDGGPHRVKARRVAGEMKREMRTKGVKLTGDAYSGLYNRKGDERLRVVECNKEEQAECSRHCISQLIEISDTAPVKLMEMYETAMPTEVTTDLAVESADDTVKVADVDYGATPYYLALPEPKPVEIRKALKDTWAMADLMIPRTRLSLLYGPPGTGKTTLACRSALLHKQALYVVTLTDQTPSAELRGHFVPKGGCFVWHEGIALRPFKYGGTLVLNEACEAGADTLTFLYCLMDDPTVARISLPNGETVRPHPDFRVVCTMNGVPEDLPDALADRMQVKILIDRPHPNAIKRLPVRLQRIARKLTATKNETERVGMRSWLEFARMAEVIGSDQIAATAIFQDRATDILQAISYDNDEQSAEAQAEAQAEAK